MNSFNNLYQNNPLCLYDMDHLGYLQDFLQEPTPREQDYTFVRHGRKKKEKKKEKKKKQIECKETR